MTLECFDCFFVGAANETAFITGFMYVCSQLCKREKLAAIKIFVYFLSHTVCGTVSDSKLHDIIWKELVSAATKMKFVVFPLQQDQTPSVWATHTPCKKKFKKKSSQTFILEWEPEVDHSGQLRIRKRVEDESF